MMKNIGCAVVPGAFGLKKHKKRRKCWKKSSEIFGGWNGEKFKFL